MRKLAIIILTSATLSGCASIMEGKSQNINITTSNGQNVEATVYTKAGIQEVRLPHHFAVQKDSQDITVNVKEGRCNKETTTVVKSRLEPWFWGNILSGGIIGSTTDSLTGAMWQYDDTVVVNINEKATCER